MKKILYAIAFLALSATAAQAQFYPIGYSSSLINSQFYVAAPQIVARPVAGAANCPCGAAVSYFSNCACPEVALNLQGLAYTTTVKPVVYNIPPEAPYNVSVKGFW